MKITSKGEYAAKAVLYLALKHPEIVPIQEIAERHNIPLKYLEHILLLLKNAGVLRSRRGVKGGYQLNKPADQITVGEVVTIVDGNFAKSSCPDTNAAIADYGCPDVEICGLKAVWDEVKTAVENILYRTTFEDIRKRSLEAMAARSEYVGYQI